MAEPTLYERLGGVFSIAAVVAHFSDAVVDNRVAGYRGVVRLYWAVPGDHDRTAGRATNPAAVGSGFP